MGYSREAYRQIREKYRTKALAAEEKAEKRTAEVYAASPELEKIDRELRKTASEIALATFGVGESWRENLTAVREKNLALQAKRKDLLTALGYPVDYTDPPYECEACRDSGYVGIRMCDCMRKELVYASFAASGLGDLIRTQTFENFDLGYYAANSADYVRMKQNLELVRTYAETFDGRGDNLLFCGGTGLGKTHLSTALARRVMERGYDVSYTSAINLFGAFEAARFGNNTAGGGEEPARYHECELLIIDDLGTEVVNQFTVSCLYMVLNNRLNAGQATVVSTNLSPKEIKERYVDRVASRLLGEFRPVLFVGTDVRRQKLTRK